MKHPLFNLLMAAISATLLYTAPMAMAEDGAMDEEEAVSLQEVESAEKLLHYRRNASSGGRYSGGAPISIPHQERLHVQLATEKRHYRAGEPIRFTASGNRDFYLYLFNRDPISGKWITILPNRLQTAQQIKYPGDNRARPVPNAQLEFYSDRRGTEQLVMVASERYLDVEKMSSISQSKSLGDYYEWNDPLESLRIAINDSYADELGEEKMVRVRSRPSGNGGLASNGSAPNGLISKEFELRIY